MDTADKSSIFIFKMFCRLGVVILCLHTASVIGSYADVVPVHMRGGAMYTDMVAVENAAHLKHNGWCQSVATMSFLL